MAMALPRFAVLQSCYTNKYMGHIQDDGPLRGYIPFTEESVLSPYAKIEFEMSKTVPNSFYIRCCYNNKYWIRSSSADGSTILALAEDREPKPKVTNDGQNQNGWESDPTLFKVEKHPKDSGIISINCMANGDVVSVKGNRDGVQVSGSSCLFGVKSEDLRDREIMIAQDPDSLVTHFPAQFFWLIDRDALCVLPRYVAFKGDNGFFLRQISINGRQHLQFSSQDPLQVSCQCEIITENNGSIRIRSVATSGVWTIAPDMWVLADPRQNMGAANALFWPVKVAHNKVSLRNGGNNNFCSRVTGAVANCLQADSRTARFEATLEVQELVLSRQIYNVNFRQRDARVYDEQVLHMGSITTTNLSDVETASTLKFSYTKTTTYMWTGSVSLALGIQVTIRAGLPFLLQKEVSISAEVEGSYEWGEATETSKTVEEEHHLTVPPKTRVISKLTSTKAKCDVPFSYTQRDILINGTVAIASMDDGVYSGSDIYNVHVETYEEPID